MGKALSSLIAQAHLVGAPVRHVVACLEKPEKNQFIDRLREGGGEVIVAPSRSRLDELVSGADIVQLEWWNHPATIACLCALAPQPLRLLVWCHVSGLHNPIIPPKLMELAHRFLFTSPCSFEARQVSGVAERLGSRLSVVSSGGGFEGLPKPKGNDSEAISVGYLGSLNFAKLHPDYVEFLAAVTLPDFTVKLIGDQTNREVLERQCDALGRTGMLDFRGYTTDVAAELGAINVLAYLLNPCHYGTAENALLEAMAMGIVPVVLDNPAERNIVEHLRTGLIVHSPAEFADAIEWLASNPAERSRIGERAAAMVRERYTSERMESAFRGHYDEVMIGQKRLARFEDVFGTTPDAWFLSCQRDPGLFGSDSRTSFSIDQALDFCLFERTKGTVFHFHDYFPENENLTRWSGALARECPVSIDSQLVGN